MDFLCLPTWQTIDINEAENITVVTAQLLTKLKRCPRCGRSARVLRPHGTKPQQFNDSPVRDRPVIVRISRRRFICAGPRGCGRTSLQPLSDIHEQHQMTTRLVQFIERHSLARPFAHVSAEAGVSATTVKSVFARHVARLDAETRPSPRTLGLDGVYVRRRERLLIVDIERRRVIDLCPSIREADVAAALRRLPGRKGVAVVVIDMSATLRRAIRKALPQAVIVVDRFHVQQMINRAVNQVRIELGRSMPPKQRRRLMRERTLLFRHEDTLTDVERNTLNDWLAQLPRLRVAYDLKRRFQRLWQSSCSQTAQARYTTWRKTVPADLQHSFAELTTAMGNWGQEVFAYCDHARITNGFTESVNRRIKTLAREGCGYSLATLRAKAVFQHEAAVRTALTSMSFQHRNDGTRRKIR